MKFTEGQKIRCINVDHLPGGITLGEVYQVYSDDGSDNIVMIWHDNGNIAGYNKMRFQPVETTDTDPTLTDFDRIRLETALKLLPLHDAGGTFQGALNAADDFINLIISTPFKRSE